MNKRQELGIAVAVIAGSIGVMGAIGPTPPLNSSKQTEHKEVDVRSESPQIIKPEAEQRYTRLLGKPRSPPLLPHDPHLGAKERRAQREIHNQRIEKDFLSLVDRNEDHYLAPEEITSTLHRCGYTGPCGYGDLELHVWSQDEDVSVRNASEQHQTTAYRVSTDFAERCVKQGLKQ